MDRGLPAADIRLLSVHRPGLTDNGGPENGGPNFRKRKIKDKDYAQEGTSNIFLIITQAENAYAKLNY